MREAQLVWSVMNSYSASAADIVMIDGPWWPQNV
jgi:hypothetical protein